MLEAWRRNIARNRELVREGDGPGTVLLVAGRELDVAHWQRHLTRTARDTFDRDGNTRVQTVLEAVPKGNFLGTLNAWSSRDREPASAVDSLPAVTLMSMSFGTGKRLSPFTQALGNRKSAFVTPFRGSESETFLCTTDLSNLYSNLWLDHLRRSGFRGVVVKWGDEAVIPGIDWRALDADYSQVDAVRFVWRTAVTDDLARDKEWVLIDSQSGLMHYQLARQPGERLRARLRDFAGRYEPAVNLGSVAVSYRFLDLALDVFKHDLERSERTLDWDPYVWIALACRDRDQWAAEAELEASYGGDGIRRLERRFPDFFNKIERLRDRLESDTGRPLAIATLDFGRPFWVDLGLHGSVRRCLESLPLDTDEGRAAREFFALPSERDSLGNIVVGTSVAEGASVEGSLLVDTVIADPRSVVNGGVLVGGRLGRVSMPFGGSVLFSAADELSFTGPHAISFRSLASRIELPEGGRHATLFLPDGCEGMLSNEAIVRYDASTYSEPVLGNRLSFEQAAKLAAEMAGDEIERRWRRAWSTWLP